MSSRDLPSGSESGLALRAPSARHTMVGTRSAVLVATSADGCCRGSPRSSPPPRAASVQLAGYDSMPIERRSAPKEGGSTTALERLSVHDDPAAEPGSRRALEVLQRCPSVFVHECQRLGDVRIVDVVERRLGRVQPRRGIPRSDCLVASPRDLALHRAVGEPHQISRVAGEDDGRAEPVFLLVVEARSTRRIRSWRRTTV